VERGLLSFDDPLWAHVPDVLDAETARSIRIEHLLSHSSGLGDYLDEMKDSPQVRYRTLDDFLGLVRGDTLQFQPGEKFGYSNAGYLLLGRVIEAVSGENYYDYVRDHIYEPAAMLRAGAEPQDQVIDDLAVGYDKEFTEEGVRFRNNRFVVGLRGGPAGGGYATILDLLSFANALQRGELLDEELVAVLTSAKPDLGSTRYGYGFTVDTERNIVGHSGGFAGVSANLDIFLDHGFVGIVLSNYRGAISPVVTKIRDLVEEAKGTRSEGR
jgi:CubicO group peptidase (beta-lactamase class C family)